MHFLILSLLLAISEPVDLLALAGVVPGPGAPPGWKVREVRGQRAPEIEVRNDGAGPVLRLRGAGRAAWFYRELAPSLPDSGGVLRWSWRVIDAPDAADMQRESMDDSPLRVYVVFGREGWFRSSPRAIFYTYGNAEAEGFARRSFSSDKVYTIRVDGLGQRARWQEHSVDPFADYRRVWNQSPPPITAIGIMQDTDQTRAQATAELRQLQWFSR